MERTWRIGEVAERTGLTRRTLRHYEELGLLTPSGRSWSDYRLYDAEDLVRLLQIQNLKALGLSLPEIGEALADPAMDAAATLRSHLAHLQERIADERRLADRLAGLAATPERSWDDVLDAIALAQQLSHPDPIVRLRAALRAPGSTTAELLPALVGERDPAVQEVLVWALAQQPDAAGAAVQRLDDPDPDLRCLMARLLAKLRDPSTVPALLARLSDSEPRVVDTAANALGRIGAPEAAGPLAGLLGDDRLDAATLTEALAAFGADAVTAVAERLAADSAATRQHAAEVLGRLESVAAVPALTTALGDSEEDVRLAALLALGELGPQAREAIQLVVSDPQLGGVARRLLDLHVT